MMELPIDQLAGLTAEEAAELQSDDALADQERRRQERLGLFGERLDKLFREQVALKSPTEERWLQDLRRYEGRYDDAMLGSIREAGGSEAFVNLTRVKCNATEARIADTVLPTGDRNWAIEHTPVPELARAQRDTSLVRGPDGSPRIGPDGKPTRVADAVAALVAEAKKAADLMQQEMDDQLQECQYNAVLRQVIRNTVVYGTGILKGPVIRARMKIGFSKVQEMVPGGVPRQMWKLNIQEDLAPGAECVSPWDFFPDMRARNMREAEFVFERHRMNSMKLRELAKLPGFMPDQIKDVLASEPTQGMAGLIDQADSEETLGHRGRGTYEVIEYSGPIDVADLEAAGIEGLDADDKLQGYYGTVWFCNGRVLKAVLSMLQTNELMYDVMVLERDDSSIFGKGVPAVMEQSQRAANAAWRMILDNAALSVGGQIVTKTGKVKPKNGNWRPSPLKHWEVTDPNASIDDVIQILAIPSNLSTIFTVFETARYLSDEETGLPMIAQGQQSPAITKTAQGMTLLMNSANVVLRRIVKEFDDAVTSPFITRLYRWNMQFNEREDIKGDYHVVALGSSALMLKEQQAQGLMQLGSLAGTNPEFAMRTKWGDLYRQIVKAMSISAESLIKTEEEVEFEKAQAAQQPPEVPPEVQIKMAELQMKGAQLQLEQARAQTEAQVEAARLAMEQAKIQGQTETERRKVELTFQAEQARAQAALAQAQADVFRIQMEREALVLKLAAERDLTMEQIRKEFGIKAMDIDSKHQLFNAERAVKQEFGEGM